MERDVATRGAGDATLLPFVRCKTFFTGHTDRSCRIMTREYLETMRIAIFTDTYRPEINGVVTSIESYRKELERQGHEVYVFAPRYFGMEDSDPGTVRFPSIPFPFPLMKERRLSAPGKGGMRFFGRTGFDIIHSQVPANMGIMALFCSWFWKVPHVHTYHTHYMEYMHYMPFPRSFSRRAIIWIARHFCGRCQYIIAPSATLAGVIRGYGVDAPIAVIPTGVDISAAGLSDDVTSVFRRHHLKVPTGLAGSALLTSVGRLGREKNILFLIRAVARLMKRGENVHLIMIGDGPDRKEIEDEIDRLGCESAVTLTGYLDRTEVLSLIKLSALFVFASQTETQGLVLLESMAVGTPVVALHGPGVTDLMDGDIGGCATSPDIEQFVDAVRKLLHDEQLREAKARGALARAAEWSMTNETRKLLDVYRRSIAEFRHHGLPRYRHRHRY
jgi:1,2-diacylglycerol 3-alpha-glucosyltransferase